MTPCAYILLCADGTLYTGWTSDIEKRLAAHNAGRGAKYTRGRRPVTLLYSEECATKSEAMKRGDEPRGRDKKALARREAHVK